MCGKLQAEVIVLEQNGTSDWNAGKIKYQRRVGRH